MPLVDGPAEIPVGMYSAPPDRMQALADAGFSWAGPFYPGELPLAPDRLEAARRSGLGVLVPIGWHRRGDQPSPWDAATAEREIATAVAAFAADETIAGWYLLPEELRPHEPGDLAYLELATRTIRDADPRRRPIMGYQTNARPAPQLRPIARHLDSVAKGAYANWSGHRDQRAWVRWSAEQVVSVSGPGQMPLSAVEMFEDPPGASASDLCRWARHDVLLALLAGARGILVFSGWRRPNFERYDDYFAAYAEVVADLRRPGVAAALLGGTSPSVRIAAGPGEVDVTAGRDRLRYGSITAATAGEITIVVNSASEAVVVALPDTCGELEAGHASWYPRARLLDLPPAGSAVIRGASAWT
jgi:hypothetical protein